MVPWNGPRTKVQLKLTSQRCVLLQEKKNAMAKKARREIASLVDQRKLDKARIKSEGLIGEDLTIELLEFMELYVEMLIVSRVMWDLSKPALDVILTPSLTSYYLCCSRGLHCWK
jgi:vacuolar protein sorting-associated protein IST1